MLIDYLIIVLVLEAPRQSASVVKTDQVTVCCLLLFVQYLRTFLV